MKSRIQSIELAGRACMLCLPERLSEPATLFLCHMGAEAGALAREVFARLPRDFAPVALAAVTDVVWDRDYTPWPSDCLSGRAFSGGAEAYLDYVEGTFLPGLQEELSVRAVYSLGYSLGGLCALHALTRSACYSGGLSVSGALWYPGFLSFFQARRPSAPVYCSLGRSESRTRHPVMRCGADCAQAIASRPGDCFEWTNGNHFFEIPQRLALAIQWACRAG